METTTINQAMLDVLAAIQESQTATAANYTSQQIEESKKLFLRVAHSVCPSFTVDDANRDAVGKVFRYAMRIPTEGIDPDRGLWLHGDIGTGKTTLLKIYQKFVDITYPRTASSRITDRARFRIYPCMSVCLDFASQGYEVLKQHIDKTAAYDELGSEPRVTNYYGTPVNVFEYLLQIRYGRGDLKTHVTTNLTMDQVAERYGDRIEDRCMEMFNRIEMNGDSRRHGVL